MQTTEIKNKRAEFEYFLLNKYKAGLVLTGTEIKSIRHGKANLSDAYCYFKDGEMVVKNLHISEYRQGSYNNHDPKRLRYLLLKKGELKKIQQRVKEKGVTIVPLRIFINERGYAKIEIALAKGKKYFDKRHSIKQKDVQREMNRNSKYGY